MATTLKNTAPFDPRTISGLQLWLDSTDTSKMILSGNNILSLSDKSSNATVFSASATPPTLSSTAYNGLYPLQFNGSSFFNNSSFSYGLTNRSAFLVVGGTGGNNNNGFLSFANTLSDFNRLNALAYETGFNSGSQYFQSLSGFQVGGVVTNLSGLSTTPFALYTDTFSSGVATLYQNGTFGATASSGATFTTSSGLYIGARMAGGTVGNYLTGVIAEVLLFSRAVTTSERQQIEGYLAWKWGLNANLPASHPFKNGIAPFRYPIVSSRIRPIPLPYFDPRTISGLQLWLDAADSSTITLSSGSNISSWRDKSGNGYLATGENSPLLNSTTKYILFNGINQAFSLSSGAFPSGNSPYSIFIVAYTNNALNPQWILAGGTETTNQALGIIFFTTNAVWHSWWVNEYRIDNSIQNTIPSVIYAGYTTQRSLSITGGTITTNNPNATRSNPTSPNYIGRRVNGSQFLEGGIGEILIFNTELDTLQRQRIEGYLAWKWGIQRNLPTSHSQVSMPTNIFQLTSPSKIRNTITSQTFTYTGVTQTLVVPGGLTSMLVILWGGGGGTGDQASGGGGAFVQGTLTVVPGETLTIVVGRAGTTSHTYSFYSEAHGFGGVSGNIGAGGGGGFTGIKRGSSYIVMAGGGGGAGGGSNTYSGGAGTASGHGFQGGTGGVKSTAANGNNIGGGSSSGGTIAGSIGTYQAGGYGGGGGGGFNGGGNSIVGGYIGGGGGGSSLTSNLTNTTLADGSGSTPGNVSSPLRGTAGNGGVPGGQAPGNGLLILRYRA